MTEDTELLRRFALERSESAFTELVRRKAGLVYSAALRQLDGDELLAQDVSQEVFLALARKARRLADRPVLASWLYQSTRYAALKARRTRQRRQRRERENQIMENDCHESARDAEWQQVRPLIDQAVWELPARDREIVLQRYFEGQSYAVLAAKNGLGEGAARMRAERALEKLRGLLARRGVTSTIAALAAVLSSSAVAAPPPGLPAVLAGHALAKSALATGSGLTFKFLSLGAMKKLQLGVAAFFAVAASGVAYHEPDEGIHTGAFTVFAICFGTGLLFALLSALLGHVFDAHADFEVHAGFGHGGHGGDAAHPPGAHGQAEAGYASDMPGFAPIGPTTVATFVTAFGGFGMVLIRSQSLHRFSGPLAAILAFAVAASVAAIFRSIFRHTQASSEGRVGALVGTKATVITPIPAEGVGEIAYVQNGSRYSAPARTETREAVSGGSTVEIVRIVGTQFYVHVLH